MPAATLATVARGVTSPSRFAIAPAALTYEMPIRACTVAPRRASNPTHAPEPRPARSAPVRYPSPPEEAVPPGWTVPSCHVPVLVNARSKVAVKNSR